jgi:hypothetical protein
VKATLGTNTLLRLATRDDPAQVAMALQLLRGALLIPRLMVDNLKSAVLKRLVGQAPVFNPKYLDFSRHWGFEITPCNVASGWEKGRVENGVGYVKKNFLAGQEFIDFSAVQPAAQLWVDTVADVRVHGATNRRPVDMFEEERAHLKPLNPVGFDLARVRTVSCRRQQAISERSARRIERIGAEPAALQLTRSADLLELEIPEPDLSIYDRV